MEKVLVVDDCEVVRKILGRMLRTLPLELWEAENGEQGLALVLSEAFDLVITDYLMPKLDGLEMIAQCRQKFPELPFILISGTQPENVEKLDEVYFLGKPIGIENLLPLVKFILDID